LKKNIVLLGFMGTGKTVVGKALSNKLNLPLYDTDDLVESRSRMSINEIFDQHGENYFRELETKILREFLTYETCIISTGGGIVLKEDNWKILDDNPQGLKVSLMATPDTVYERVKDDDLRPLLQVEDPYQRICELLEKRKELYLKAEVVIWTDGKTVEELVDDIIGYYKARDN